MFAVTYVQFLENITGRRPAGAVVQDHRDYQGFINLDQFIQANPVSLQPNVFEAIECNISFNTPLLDVVLAAHVRSEEFSLSPWLFVEVICIFCGKVEIDIFCFRAVNVQVPLLKDV